MITKFQIVDSLWVLGQKRMYTKQGYDLLGSMVVNLVEIPMDTVLPTQLKGNHPPFTQEIRRRVVLSPLSVEILQLDYINNKSHVKQALERICAKYNLSVEYVP